MINHLYSSRSYPDSEQEDVTWCWKFRKKAVLVVHQPNALTCPKVELSPSWHSSGKSDIFTEHQGSTLLDLGRGWFDLYNETCRENNEFYKLCGVFFPEKMSEVTKQLLESYDFEDVRSR